MAFDPEFDAALEEQYKRSVLDRMAATGATMADTAVPRYAASNAQLTTQTDQLYNAAAGAFGQAGAPSEAAIHGMVGELHKPMVDTANHYNSIAEAGYKQGLEGVQFRGAAENRFYDMLAQDNSLRYQTDAEMEQIMAAFNQRRAREAQDAEEGGGFDGLFGEGTLGDLAPAVDYKTAGRDILGWTQQEAMTYGTDANYSTIQRMGQDLYASGASWSETVANIDSWLQSGNIPATERSKYVAMFQAMYGPAWGEQLQPTPAGRSAAMSWGVDYTNMTPKQAAYVNAGSKPSASPTRPWETKTTGGLFGRAKRAIK